MLASLKWCYIATERIGEIFWQNEAAALEKDHKTLINIENKPLFLKL